MSNSLCDLISKIFTDSAMNSKVALKYYHKCWKYWTYLDIKLSSEIVSKILKKYIKENSKQFILLILNVTHTIPSLIFGILKSSCAFVCSSSEIEHYKRLVDKLGIEFIITNMDLSRNFTMGERKYSYLESFELMEEKCNIWRTDITAVCRKQLFAYAITTSGTTGISKIVKVTHQSIAPNIVSLSEILQIVESDVIYLSSPITFDPSIIEIFLALSNQATLYIVDKDIKLDQNKLLNLLSNKESGPTIIQTTPSILRSWNISNLNLQLFNGGSNLRALILGGESFPNLDELNLWKLNSSILVYNIYGITEVSCWATINKVWPSQNPDISIGFPLTETVIKLVNCDLNNIGEMYIGSSTRFCEINDERIANLSKELPFFRATGDLFQEIDKKYYYIGRKDDRIKRWGVSTHLKDIEDAVKRLGYLNCACISVNDDVEKRIKIGLFIFSDIVLDCLEFWRKLRCELNSSSWPDDIISMKDIPLTPHGKLDKQILIEVLKTRNNDISPEKFFTKYWKYFTGTEISEKRGFISSGGDSFSALQFISMLKRYSIPDNFLASLLQDTSYLECFTEFQKCLCYKRPLDTDISSNFMKKIKCTEKSLNVGANSINRDVIYRNIKGRIFPLHYKSDIISEKQVVFETLWSYHLGKCIDASPLVVSLKTGENLAIVGSHSGRVSVLDMHDGHQISEIILPNRVESCACISDDAKYYYIGCYDGNMYKVTLCSGSIIWSFSTEDIIKSTCCWHERTLLFGSYDKKVYKINEDGKLLWKRLIEGPVLTEVLVQNDLIHVTTLASTYHILDFHKGEELAKYKLSAPVFSTPVIVDTSIIIATVDGLIQWRSLDSSEEIHKFESNAQIFSSLTHFKEDDFDYLLFGSGTNLICLKDKLLLWKRQVDSNVIATPTLIPTSKSYFVITVSCKGVLYLINLTDGHILNEFKLPNHVYSSPAVLNDKIVLGCRDDNVYCLKLV
ncbi:hypothetical protein O3M35_006657 [Rhynocoris fuscipes]|uniref:Uncharacterized protein n=1 Tax=Rhynocoris fuscipes TaxID=488301 RepID=A0AAW1DJJ5_9HEMI